jgi:c-di-GMP-binding flagellar brake protein YcgR
MIYQGPERRKHPRVGGKFVVSYRVREEIDNYDISQTRDLSLGGMLLTTNRDFPSGTILAIEIRLPFFINAINLTGRVLGSKEVVKDLIYDTRISFLQIDPKVENIIKDTVGYYLRSRK